MAHWPREQTSLGQQTFFHRADSEHVPQVFLTGVLIDWCSPRGIQRQMEGSKSGSAATSQFGPSMSP